MSDWQNNKAFIGGTNYEEREVNGEALRFYPVSVGVMFKLRRIAKPLAGALSVLFTSQNSDYGVIQREFDNGKSKETSTEAIPVKLAELRTRERADAIEKLVEAVTDPKNADVIGAVVIDSLRDVFPRRGPAVRDNPKPGEWLESLGADTLVLLLRGVAAANKDVIGPLGDRVQAVVLDAGLVPQPEPETAGST